MGPGDMDTPGLDGQNGRMLDRLVFVCVNVSVTVAVSFGSSQARGADLDLWQAMRESLAKNYDVRLSELTQEDREAGVLRSRGEFDTTFAATFTRDHTETPSSSSLDGVTSAVISDSTSIKPTLSTKTRFGSELSLPYSYSISQSNSSYSRIPVGHNTSLGVKLTQPLLKVFEGGYYEKNVKRAEIDLEVAKAKHGEKLDDTAMKTAEIFLDALRDRETVRLQETLLSNARAAKEFVSAKESLGKASFVERLEADAATSKAEEALLASRASLANRLDDLGAHAFGSLPPDLKLNPELGSLLTPAETLDSEQLQENALARRHEVKAQDQSTQKARLELAAAEADLLPTLNLEGSYTQKGLAESFEKSQAQVDRGEFPSWSAGLKLERPLMRHAARSANQSKIFQLEQQKIKESQLVRDVKLEIKKVVRDVEIGWKRLEALQAAATAQRQRFDAIFAKFKAGVVSVATLDKARSDAESSELEHIKARFAYAKARLRLEAARGRLLEVAAKGTI